MICVCVCVCPRRSLFARRVKDSRPVEQRDPGWKLFGKVPPREAPTKDPKRIQKVQTANPRTRFAYAQVSYTPA